MVSYWDVNGSYSSCNIIHIKKLLIMKNFYITFGQEHAHRVNNHTFDKDSVGIIKARNESDARDIAFELFGQKFARYRASQVLFRRCKAGND